MKEIIQYLNKICTYVIVWNPKKPKPINVYPRAYDKGELSIFKRVTFTGYTISNILYKLGLEIQEAQCNVLNGALVLEEIPKISKSRLFGYTLNISYCYIPVKFCTDKFGESIGKPLEEK